MTTSMTLVKNRAEIQGFPIDLLAFEKALSCVISLIEDRQSSQIVTINPEMIMMAHKNPEFAKVLHDSELVIPDGSGVRLALTLKGIRQPQIRGIDFARALIGLCAQKGYRLALLGAKEEVVSKVASNLQEQYENLNIVYVQNGYFSDEQEIIQNLKNSAPQVLLCALGAPRQDILIYKLKNELQGCAMIGVGGSFDVFAGVVDEAPEIFKKLSLEWLYRTLRQPERFKRIFPTLPIFLFRSIIETVKDATKPKREQDKNND